LPIPPPDFIISASTNPMDLRPGEEKKINLNIQSKTNVNTEIVILSNKSIQKMLN